MNNKRPSWNRITPAWRPSTCWYSNPLVTWLSLNLRLHFDLSWLPLYLTQSWCDCGDMHTPATVHRNMKRIIVTFFIWPALSHLQALLYFKLKLTGWMTHFMDANWWVLDLLASLSHRFLRMIPHGSVVLAESSTHCVFEIFEIWLPPVISSTFTSLRFFFILLRDFSSIEMLPDTRVTQWATPTPRLYVCPVCFWSVS